MSLVFCIPGLKIVNDHNRSETSNYSNWRHFAKVKLKANVYDNHIGSRKLGSDNERKKLRRDATTIALGYESFLIRRYVKKKKKIQHFTRTDDDVAVTSYTRRLDFKKIFWSKLGKIYYFWSRNLEESRKKCGVVFDEWQAEIDNSIPRDNYLKGGVSWVFDQKVDF